MTTFRNLFVFVIFNISVLVCSQIRRKKEGAPNRPEISDLPYPEIADIADLVLLLHRENYYNQDESIRNCAEILIKKPTQKTIELNWDYNYLLFSDKKSKISIGSKAEILSLIKEVNKEITADKTINAFDLERQKYNLEILEQLKQFLEKEPDMRFIQALWNLAIVDREDRYNEEPQVTLEKVKAALEKIQKGK